MKNVNLRTISIWFSFILILNFIEHVDTDTNIWIHQKLGNDVSTCLYSGNKTTPCQTLHYVFGHMNYNTSNFEQNITITIIEAYQLDNPLYIDTSLANLTRISIRGYANRTLLSGNSINANIALGNKTQQVCGFETEFVNFEFRNFTENVTSVILGWSSKVSISNCAFIKNDCSAINVLNTYIYVENSHFERNQGSSLAKGQVYGKHDTFPTGANSAGGAVAVIFTRRNIKYSAVFIDNTFLLNSAVLLSGKVIIDDNENAIAFSHIGGGILFSFMEDTSYIKIYLQGNCFDSNSASLGGGLMFSYHQVSGQNNVTLLDNDFKQNTATISGGGFAVATWQNAAANTFYVKDTTFRYNSAQVGGAGRILLQSVLQSSPITPAAQFITFDRVLFMKNEAASASGLHLNYNLGTGSKPLVPVILKDVTFANHTTQIYRYSLQGPSAYTGVLLSNRVDMEFHGHNIFKYNEIESSVHISNTEFFIKGNVTFYRNTVQTSGGAMTMTDVSHLYFYNNAELTFKENYAPVEGGALFVKTVGFPDLVYKFNPSCFVQYYSDKPLPPSKWRVTVEFIHNGAGLKGAAIYTNTITSCIWDESSPPFYNFKKALRWKGFVYNGNYLSDKPTHDAYDINDDDVDIATDTKSYRILTKTEVELSPGQEMLFRMQGSDELNSSVYSVPVASINSNSGLHLEKKYYIVKPNSNQELAMTYTLSEKEYAKVSQENMRVIKDVKFVDSSSSFISNATIRIKVKKCALGYVFKLNQCVCDVRVGNHIARCENNTVYLQDGYWGYTDGNGHFYTRQCPTDYCRCNQTDYTKIGCAFHEASQCVAGRKGVLCGQCVDGYGLDLMTYKCIPCEGTHWALVIILVVALVTVIVVLLIMWFNPKFSTLIRGIVFFVQMLPYISNPNDSVTKTVLSITDWVDIGGINSVPVKSCFMKNFNSLYAVLLGYLYPGLICAILIIVYILHRFYLMTFRRSSPFQAFWILIVLTYKFLVETSLLLLHCVPLHGKGNVFYLDGSVKCYTGTHLLVTVIAVCVLFIAVIPPPIMVPLTVNGHISLGPSITDALTQGLRKYARWWWSFDFVRRIIFISIYVFVRDSQLKQLLFTVCSMTCLSLHIQYQPYRNQLANSGETFLLFCLTLLIVIQPIDQNLGVGKTVVVSVILIVACLYCLCVTLYVWVTFLVKKCRSRGGYTAIEDDMSVDSDSYKENFRRRVSGGYKYGRRAPFFKSPVNKLRKAYSDMGHGRAPSPAYTRSDLNDDFS